MQLENNDLIQSILTALAEIQKRPELLEDGTSQPWQIATLKRVDSELWAILESESE